jgi:stage V sporulation protein R
LHTLWGFDVHLESWDGDTMLKRMSCPSISVEL